MWHFTDLLKHVYKQTCMHLHTSAWAWV